MCFRTHCDANVSGVQHRENGPTPSTGPNRDEGHLLFSFALTRSTSFRVVIILYWGFLRAIRSVLRVATYQCLIETLIDASLMAKSCCGFLRLVISFKRFAGFHFWLDLFTEVCFQVIIVAYICGILEPHGVSHVMQPLSSTSSVRESSVDGPERNVRDVFKSQIREISFLYINTSQNDNSAACPIKKQ